MTKKKCPLCKSTKLSLIWNDKIRDGSNLYSKNKIKILLCGNCNLRYKSTLTIDQLDNIAFREKYNGEASIKKYLTFNKSRELTKFKQLEGVINFKNKNILESNCGGGAILSILRKKAKIIAGIECPYFRDYLKKKKMKYFENIYKVQNSKIKFDVILSLGDLEHQLDPILFIRNFKKILNKRGIIIFRIPNFDNIYRFLLNKIFLKDDYRTSHNYYFNQKSLDFLFKKMNLKIIKKTGLHEYSINNLISYLKYQKRPKINEIKILETMDDKNLQKNLEASMTSTSLLYILKKNV